MSEPVDRQVQTDAESELDEARLPFTEHLRELRTRTIRMVLYVVCAFGFSWAFREEVFRWYVQPYYSATAAATGVRFADLSYISVIEPIVVFLKSSLSAAVLGSMPFVLTEAWLFVAPGLYKKERRLAAPFLISSILFFVGGVLFCRYLVMELAIDVLLKFGADAAAAIITMSEYFSFASRLFLVFGLFFEMPVAISFLAAVGLVTHHMLIRHWRIAVVAAVIVGAMLTPPDPITQLALAVPMVALYGLSIVLAYLITNARAASES